MKSLTLSLLITKGLLLAGALAGRADPNRHSSDILRRAAADNKAKAASIPVRQVVTSNGALRIYTGVSQPSRPEWKWRVKTNTISENPGVLGSKLIREPGIPAPPVQMIPRTPARSDQSNGKAVSNNSPSSSSSGPDTSRTRTATPVPQEVSAKPEGQVHHLQSMPIGTRTPRSLMSPPRNTLESKDIHDMPEIPLRAQQGGSKLKRQRMKSTRLQDIDAGAQQPPKRQRLGSRRLETDAAASGRHFGRLSGAGSANRVRFPNGGPPRQTSPDNLGNPPSPPSQSTDTASQGPDQMFVANQQHAMHPNVANYMIPHGPEGPPALHPLLAPAGVPNQFNFMNGFVQPPQHVPAGWTPSKDMWDQWRNDGLP